MPNSSEDFSALVFKPRGTNLSLRQSRTISFVVAFVLGLPIAAFVVVFYILPNFRTPIGPAHEVDGLVEATGYTGKGALVATVRLAGGNVVWVRIPYSPNISVGSSVKLNEQPRRFGPPTYGFAGVRKSNSIPQ